MPKDDWIPLPRRSLGLRASHSKRLDLAGGHSAKLRIPCAAPFRYRRGMKAPQQPEVIPIDKELPAVGKKVIVVCRQFKLSGYRDEKGVWREDRRAARELKDVIGWHEFGLGE